MAMPKSFRGLRKFLTDARTLVIEFHFLLPSVGHFFLHGRGSPILFQFTHRSTRKAKVGDFRY